jgi:hypothetical protein
VPKPLQIASTSAVFQDPPYRPEKAVKALRSLLVGHLTRRCRKSVHSTKHSSQQHRAASTASTLRPGAQPARHQFLAEPQPTSQRSTASLVGAVDPSFPHAAAAARLSLRRTASHTRRAMAGRQPWYSGTFVRTALPMFGFVTLCWYGLEQLMSSKLKIRVRLTGGQRGWGFGFGG